MAISEENKAGYTAQDAPSTRLKITRDGRTYGPTDLRTDTTSYRDATPHLKREEKGRKRRKKERKRKTEKRREKHDEEE